MPPGPGFRGASIELDFLYAVIIVIACIAIYMRTKESYELTGHKGIGFFRKTFLFFGIAYFIRFFVRIFMLGFDLHTLLPRFIIFPVVTAVFFYATTMAVLFLVYSVAWKKLGKKLPNETSLHFTAIIIALVSLLLAAPFLPLIIQTALLLYAVIEIYTTKKKHHSDFRHIYSLLFIFSLLSIADIAIPNFFRTAQLIIYLLSTGVFLTILYKVYQKTKPAKK